MCTHRDTRGTRAEKRPREDTGRKRPSASQGERPPKKPSLPTCCTWTSAPRTERPYTAAGQAGRSVALCCGSRRDTRSRGRALEAGKERHRPWNGRPRENREDDGSTPRNHMSPKSVSTPPDSPDKPTWLELEPQLGSTRVTVTWMEGQSWLSAPYLCLSCCLHWLACEAGLVPLSKHDFKC